MPKNPKLTHYPYFVPCGKLGHSPNYSTSWLKITCRLCRARNAEENDQQRLADDRARAGVKLPKSGGKKPVKLY